MKDEIKEKMTIGKAKKILRGFLAKDCYYDTPLYYAIPYLLDYITNLEKRLDFIIEKNDKKQEIIDKAIEYINSCTWSNGIDEEIQYSLHVPTLLNILQGEDNE